MFGANVETVDQHPFGHELAQVSELAEEYGISKEKLAIVDEEEQDLISRGLFKFRAEDYMSEIHGLFVHAFGESRPRPMASNIHGLFAHAFGESRPPPMAAMWI